VGGKGGDTGGEAVRNGTRRRRGRLRLALSLLPVAALAGCGPEQNALAPKSHQAKDIASLFWWMMGGSWLGLGLVVFLLVWAWKRRHRRGIGADTEGPKPGERVGWFVVVGLGILMPIVAIATLFVVSDIFVIRTTQAPAGNATKLTVRVIGHEWWWEVRYPGTDAVTANEIHIPVRTPVRVEVQTADVIHSFWVPELNRKIDTLPGQTNAIELYADAVGRYRGECAEFCGVQHAHMSMVVFAQPADAFRRWLAAESRPAQTATGAGARLFLDDCSSCHTIRGTPARGFVGPDLTHVGSRTSLAGYTIPNTRAHLAQWIAHPQQVKPGNQMPDLPLSGTQVRQLVAYLEGLR
jgi:cytochrome c oxidase subunit II